ncbi:MFS transporter [Streptomyces sp. ISL-66]|uniref:MFS transporter n=1 Tax=Streptomyces sp. ISL-66 TaxID=2819186 RepID=UPI001BE57687|nr:MFS transporter [Streptomyces sp. ISL-66]MBT2469814.1 MFS transporter [Streptomyces sp. ISL-66]
MTQAPTRSPASSAEGGSSRAAFWRVNALVFAVLLLDGYDTTSLGFVVPALARDWGLPPAVFAPALVMTNVGVVIGYLLCSSLAARFGRRNVIIAGTAFFAAGSAVTVMAHGVGQLAVMRLVTAIGLGMVLPTSISLAAAHSPRSRRGAYTVAVALALGVGSMAGGLVGGRLIASFGWTSVFWLGALLPVALLPALFWGLPREQRIPAATEADGRSQKMTVAGLFSRGSSVNTVLLWAFALLVFTTMFALQAWLPTILTTGYGLTPEQAPMGSAVLGMGGIVGGLLLIPVAARFGILRALAAAALIGAAFLVAASQLELGGTGLFLTLGVAGAGITAGVVGQAGLAVTMYEPAAQTTGVAWAATFGRAGSVVGPAVAGALIGLGAAGQDVLLLAGGPVALAAAVALVAAVRSRRGRGTATVA